MAKKKERGLYEPSRRLQELRTYLRSSGGATVYDIADRLHVCVRTSIRYLGALESAGELAPKDEDDEVDLDGKRRIWRLERKPNSAEPISFTTTQMLALSLSRRVFDFLAGTGFKEDLDDVFASVEATLKRRDFEHAKNLDRKLLDLNEKPHIYANRLDDVNDIVSALLSEQRLSVTHGSVAKWGKRFELEPYTLVVYKKGLYLLGRSSHHQGIRTFSLDGFRDVERLKKAKFEYPADYRPEKLFEGAFGMMSGPLARVRIRFDHEVARYIRRRQWHPTQQLKQVGDDLELTMDVAGTTEVLSWVLEWGDKALVLEPEKLRDEVAAAHRRAAARYEARSTKAARGAS